jgi:pimeloyl-ACP methyl ester carboxylesterase
VTRAANRAVTVDGARLEYELIPAPEGSRAGPSTVFLHEGLGSLDLWREFPAHVRERLGGPTTLRYSRRGYGFSSPVTEPRRVSYMHEEATVVLPKLLDHLGLEDPVLLGHSDGASIALLHAAAGYSVRGLVLLAPHVFVEDCTIAAISESAARFEHGDLRGRIARHHADPDGAFWGWNRIWLDPQFRKWNIEAELPSVRCPALVVQGTADPYGTVAQVEAIRSGSGGPVETMILDGVGHAPQVEAEPAVLDRVAEFVARAMR